MQKLINPALQVNMSAVEVPKDRGGNMTLKIPVNKPLESKMRYEKGCHGTAL
ncbi:hypothetical protein [Tateyamaria omphalii]|uniref:hypothetical protein n=1 Tax=Tateyamaria omphalii TaxID=299262 RepID=UPI001E41EAE7|nr:hypothetical protein [Tateyamaria omphalii]